MKKTGSLSEYSLERAADLHRAYIEYITRNGAVSNMADVYKAIVAMPASRFWVSSRRAAIVVADILRGAALPPMRECRLSMFMEIAARVEALRVRQPDRALLQLVREVVEQPAPCFYLTPRTARNISEKYRKCLRTKKRASRR